MKILQVFVNFDLVSINLKIFRNVRKFLAKNGDEAVDARTINQSSEQLPLHDEIMDGIAECEKLVCDLKEIYGLKDEPPTIH